MKNTQFKSTIAEIIDMQTSDAAIHNPFLTKIKFTFADNQGNGNNQGIEEEDFDSIAQSALNMPIKIRYSGKEAAGHEMSTPIGHITGMEKEVDGEIVKLIGEAFLYREEYPKEVQFLKDAHAEGKAPGISWELAYQDSVLKNGVEWLKQAVTVAATFVKVPAYGRRTQLLAIAQANSDDTEFMTELQDFMNSWAEKNKPKGGNKVEEELEKANEALQVATAQIAEVTEKLTEATTKIEALESENETYKTQATLAERITKVSEAGLKFELEGDALTAKHDLWLSMSQVQFDAYVDDLTAAIKSVPVKTAAASLTKPKDSLPKFSVAGQDLLSLDDLKATARRASRGELADL